MQPKPMEKHGTCELCGKPDQDLQMLYLADWQGRCCDECLRQLMNSQIRKYCPCFEQTEEAE